MVAVAWFSLHLMDRFQRETLTCENYRKEISDPSVRSHAGAIVNVLNLLDVIMSDVIARAVSGYAKNQGIDRMKWPT